MRSPRRNGRSGTDRGDSGPSPSMSAFGGATSPDRSRPCHRRGLVEDRTSRLILRRARLLARRGRRLSSSRARWRRVRRNFRSRQSRRRRLALKPPQQRRRLRTLERPNRPRTSSRRRLHLQSKRRSRRPLRKKPPSARRPLHPARPTPSKLPAPPPRRPVLLQMRNRSPRPAR